MKRLLKKEEIIGWAILLVSAVIAFFGANSYVDSYMAFLKGLGK